MIERAEDSQLAALRAFTLLTALRSHCPGGLILACGLEPRGAALMIAGNIAGACCLAIEERAEVTRATLRSGASDFVVNSVDEALRVLKNEVRQGRPLSVGLTMAVEPALTELLERGVLPEVFTAFDRVHATAVSWAAMEFAAMGTQVVNMDEGAVELGGAMDGPGLLARLLFDRQWGLESFRFESGEELRAFDARLLERLPAGDVRRRWCAGAARFFHRERPYRRVMYLTAKERDAVVGA
jgi:urocanate hydratase